MASEYDIGIRDIQEGVPCGNSDTQGVGLIKYRKLRKLIRQIRPSRQTSNQLIDKVRDLSNAVYHVKMTLQLFRISVDATLSRRATPFAHQRDVNRLTFEVIKVEGPSTISEFSHRPTSLTGTYLYIVSEPTRHDRSSMISRPKRMDGDMLCEEFMAIRGLTM
jgi:hypothetical protein